MRRAVMMVELQTCESGLLGDVGIFRRAAADVGPGRCLIKATNTWREGNRFVLVVLYGFSKFFFL